MTPFGIDGQDFSQVALDWSLLWTLKMPKPYSDPCSLLLHPITLSFAALTKRDSGLKIPYVSTLLSSGLLKRILPLFSCHFELVKNASSQHSHLDARKINFACVGLAKKKMVVRIILSGFLFNPMTSSFPRSPPSQTHP